MKLQRLLLGAGLLTLLASGAAALVRAPDPRPPAARMEARREAALTRVVRLRAEPEVFSATLGELGITLDVEATLAEAARLARARPFWRRASAEPAPVWKLDAARARAHLTSLAPRVARAAVDARVDLTAHTRVLDAPGRELDVESTLAALALAGHAEGEIVELRLRAVPAQVSRASLTPVLIEKVVAAFETTFSLSGHGEQRAANIARAAAYLDGAVIPPGGTLSFNDRVGPRTVERGFGPAPELHGDILHLGYGGGTCQTSSTLHAAAIYGAMRVLERHEHAHPSTYMPLGLDATVSYPLSDLKLENTLPYPVLVHAYLPRPDAVRVEILGGDPIAKVEYAFETGPGLTFGRRVEVKPGMRGHVLHQRGIPGANVNSVVTIRYLDGREDIRSYFSGYRPAAEVYWVGAGSDPAVLPALFGG